jgi:hypothetical protein
LAALIEDVGAAVAAVGGKEAALRIENDHMRTP